MYKNAIKVMSIFFLTIAILITTSQPASALAITITIYIGKASKGCSGFGFCGIVISSELKAARQVASKDMAATAELSGDKMQVSFNRPLPGSGKEELIPIDEDLVLDAETSKAFGFKRVVVLKGEYPINRRGGKFGSTVFNVRTER
jgi:hypothetical protein